jgi:hypothetical protein
MMLLLGLPIVMLVAYCLIVLEERVNDEASKW